MRTATDIARGPAPAEQTGGARRVTRVAAFILAALVAVHLLFLFEFVGESPVWPTAMLDLQDRLGMPVVVSHGPVGLMFGLIGVLLAVAIWRWASRLAALVFAVAASWEAFFQAQALWPPLLMGESLPRLSVLSAGLAVIGLVVSLTALFAAVAHHMDRRRGDTGAKRAEAMALRIRARR